MTIWFGLQRRVQHSIKPYILGHFRKTTSKAYPGTPNSHKHTKASTASTASQTLSTLADLVQIYLAFHIVTTYVAQIALCGGPSMCPTLSVSGDYLAIAKWHRRGRGIKSGDVISFTHPLVPGIGAVKRVVGLPGDFVVTDWEQDPQIQGLYEPSETLIVDGDEAPSHQQKQKRMIQIPDGHCWVLGDNLAESRDSRTYGPLPLALVKGKVLGRVLPWKDRKWMSNAFEGVEGLD